MSNDKSIAYTAGVDARSKGLSLEDTAFIKLREGSKQYNDFLDGYNALLEDLSSHVMDAHNYLTVKPKRGGARKGAGAPKKDDPAVRRSIRLNNAHWIKFKAMGGEEWLRRAIDESKP